MFETEKSFQLKQERGEPIKIEMPPLPEETQVEQEPVEELQEFAQEVAEVLAQPEAPKENDASRNLRALREKSERIERERDEAIRRLQEMEAVRAPQAPQEDEDFHLAPDELAEGKHLSKVDKKIKKLEEQLRQYQQQSTTTNVETKLRTQYSDFDKVVSRENIDSLREQYPELAATINSSPDLYNKASSAYTMIKKLGIYQDDMYKADVARAQKNAAKPRTVTSISPQQGDSPLTRANAFANGLTEELSKQLRKEMNDAIRNA